MVKNQVSSLNNKRPLVDHFDLTNPKAVEKIEEIFDDYTKGANPTFDTDTAYISVQMNFYITINLTVTL